MTDLGAFENEEIVVDDVNRDGYGFALRPQHIQRYREYANIYKVWQTHTHTYICYPLVSCSNVSSVLILLNLCHRVLWSVEYRTVKAIVKLKS
jgi:hypothetical protein